MTYPDAPTAQNFPSWTQFAGRRRAGAAPSVSGATPDRLDGRPQGIPGDQDVRGSRDLLLAAARRGHDVRADAAAGVDEDVDEFSLPAAVPHRSSAQPGERASALAVEGVVHEDERRGDRDPLAADGADGERQEAVHLVAAAHVEPDHPCERRVEDSVDRDAEPDVAESDLLPEQLAGAPVVHRAQENPRRLWASNSSYYDVISRNRRAARSDTARSGGSRGLRGSSPPPRGVVRAARRRGRRGGRATRAAH